jgi:hypothetical protein
MIKFIVSLVVIVVIDIVGYVIKVRRNKSFSEHPLRMYPFAWYFWVNN